MEILDLKLSKTIQIFNFYKINIKALVLVAQIMIKEHLAFIIFLILLFLYSLLSTIILQSRVNIHRLGYVIG